MPESQQGLHPKCRFSERKVLSEEKKEVKRRKTEGLREPNAPSVLEREEASFCMWKRDPGPALSHPDLLLLKEPCLPPTSHGSMTLLGTIMGLVLTTSLS